MLFAVAVIIIVVMAVKGRGDIVSPIKSVNETPAAPNDPQEDESSITSEDLIMDMIGVDTLPESSVQPVFPE